jgi:iron complex transport system substrate-binding protein
MRKLLILLLVPFLFSCGSRTAAPQDEGDTLALKYATGIVLIQHEGYTEAVLKNPWKEGKVLHRYFLVPDSSNSKTIVPDGSPSGNTLTTVVRTPVRRAAVFTTVHCALLCDLGIGDRIAGVADLKYIKVPYVQEQVKAGRITDCGGGLNPVVEKIMDLKPDVIMLSPFENSGGYGKTEDIGIPIIECAEYMETTPLGRAEWMRFYGLLFGCEQRADSLFAVVDSSYHALRQLATTHHPTILIDKMVGNVWYVPGGRSTIGQMIKDAGGHFPWADDSHSGSLSLPFETVLERGGETDVWLFRYSGSHDITYRELLAENQGYSQFKAFRQHKVYACDVERSLFYEQSPFRPDFLLSDFIQILQPGLLNDTLKYYKPLK